MTNRKAVDYTKQANAMRAAAERKFKRRIKSTFRTYPKTWLTDNAMASIIDLMKWAQTQ